MKTETDERLEEVLKELKKLRDELQEVRGIILGIASGDLKFR